GAGQTKGDKRPMVAEIRGELRNDVAHILSVAERSVALNRIGDGRYAEAQMRPTFVIVPNTSPSSLPLTALLPCERTIDALFCEIPLPALRDTLLAAKETSVLLPDANSSLVALSVAID